MAIPIAIRKSLDSSNPNVVLQGLERFWALRAELRLSARDFQLIDELLWQSNDRRVVSFGNSILERLRRRRRPSLQNLLWSPFNPGLAGLLPGELPAAVGAMGDSQFIRDAYGLFELAQRLPGVRFFWIQPGNPQWKKPDVAEFGAICQVGRVDAWDQLPTLLPSVTVGNPGLRFSFPPLPGRGLGITPEVHRVEQLWKGQVTEKWITEDRPPTAVGRGINRIDYAVIQRFPVSFAGRKLVVVRLAGSSSLGTAGAIRHATSAFSAPTDLTDYGEWAEKINDSATVEVLLRVTDSVSSPPIPWEPTVTPVKLFIKSSPNLLNPPERVAVTNSAANRSRLNGLRYIYSEELGAGRGSVLHTDDLDFGPSKHAAIVELCKAAKRASGVVDLDAFVTATTGTPDLPVWSSGGEGARFLSGAPAAFLAGFLRVQRQ
jgi:hypothetical protein